MTRKRKEKVEYRYYEMPVDAHVLALTGEKWIQTYGRDVDYLHFHNYLEIGYCYYGEGELVLEGTVYPFTGGWFSVIPAGALHTTNSTPGTVSRWEFLYIDVERCVKDYFKERPHMMSQIQSRINARSMFLPVKNHMAMAAMIQCILREMTEKKENYKEYVTGAVMQLLVEIQRLNSQQEGLYTEKSEEISVRQDNFLNSVLEYIHINYNQAIRAADLANICCISEAHFRRVFVENFHMPPMEYINRTRIQAACDMLRKTDASITNVARLVGYSTLSTFNRNFRHFVGTTPYEWRARPENYEQKLLQYTLKAERGW